MSENRHIRVRFAPSPTGYLHLGSARTGLYNYIFARRHEGTFILRIEDTDLSRSTDEAIVQIIESMKEMGLQWDEGPGVPGPHGPYRQTERDGIYHEHVARLLETGHLYPCFCTAEELEAERTAAQAEGRGSVYSGKCRALAPEEVQRRQAAGEPYTLRVRVPEGRTVFHDILRGDVAFENDTMGDFIVQRSDGTVTYNLAVVVDDVTMEITHVIRGDDHISNTPKQVVIYEALGAGGAGVPAHAAAVRHRQEEAQQAARRDQARAAHRRGVPRRGGAQLPVLPERRVRREHDHLVAGRPGASTST